LNRLSLQHHFTMRHNFRKFRWIDTIFLYPLKKRE